VDALVGGVGSDFLSGGSGNDTLIGVDPFVPAFGFGGTADNPVAPFEIDTLTGGAGSDTFFLGDNGTVLGITREDSRPEVYYVDGGNSDFALITDFNLSEDVIQLPANYSFSLGASPADLPSGTSISFENDLIGILQGVSPSDLSLGSSNFSYV